MATDCPHCGTSVADASQRCRHRYDHIDLPVIRPMVTQVELFGGRCGGCGRRYRAELHEIAPRRAKSVAEDVLGDHPAAHPAGQALQRQIKAWRTKFFVFLVDRDVPPTNGFRSEWGAQIHAGYRSVTGTARLKGQAAFDAVRELVDGNFAIA